MSRLPSILRRFRPETWDRGRIELEVTDSGLDAWPSLEMHVDLRAGPSTLRGSAHVDVHVCETTCGDLGRLVVFDLRHATGDLRNVVERVAFDLCFVPSERPGWASLRTRAMYVPGSRFPSGLLRFRARSASEFLAAQVRPFVEAVRDEYRAVRAEREPAP